MVDVVLAGVRGSDPETGMSTFHEQKYVLHSDYAALKRGRDAFERACNENAQVIVDQQQRIAALEARCRELEARACKHHIAMTMQDACRACGQPWQAHSTPETSDQVCAHGVHVRENCEQCSEKETPGPKPAISVTVSNDITIMEAVCANRGQL